jgi:hypothetical protein
VSTTLYGDASLDGAINGIDVLMIMRVAVGISSFTPIGGIDPFLVSNVRPVNAGPSGTAFPPCDPATSCRPGMTPGNAASPRGVIDGLDALAVAQYAVGLPSTVVGRPMPPVAGWVYPLRVGPTSRYLVDQTGRPFFLAGDAAWSLIAQLSDPDVNLYLDNRQQLGFTTIMTNLIEHRFATNAPANLAGDPPFTGAPFSTPNDAYFLHADRVLQAAAARGLVVLLAPLYLGAGCGTEGWCNEVKAASEANLRAWGQYLGNRYQAYDNVVWLIGGDADPSPVQSKVQAMVDGIRSVDTRHLMTAHNSAEQTAITPWGRPAWLGVNDVYTYSTTLYQNVLSAYHIAPAMPVFLIESSYEGEGSATAQQVRAQTYWAVLSGAFGHIFGNCPVWNFNAPNHGAYCSQTDWKAALTSPGALGMQYAQRLFVSRHWQALTPDETHSVLTAGFQSGTGFAAAAATQDGSSIIAYLPTSRTVTVNGSSLGASMTAYWYNPATGTSTALGTLTTAAPQSLTPPAPGDWVLVLDNPALGFPAP